MFRLSKTQKIKWESNRLVRIINSINKKKNIAKNTWYTIYDSIKTLKKKISFCYFVKEW